MHRKPTRLGKFEKLEDRKLMAGDVRVGLEWGEAVVRGDNASNAVEIREIAANTFRVTGKADANGVATTVNGKAFADVHTWQDDLRIHLNGGNDVLTLKDLTAEDLTINGGLGADRVTLDNVRVYDRFDRAVVNLDGGDYANDTLNVSRSQLDAGLYVATGAGNDFVSLQSSTIGGETKVSLGSGNDELITGTNAALNKLYADLGEGNDRLGLGTVRINRLDAFGGSGTDTFYRHPGASVGSWYRTGFEKFT